MTDRFAPPDYTQVIHGEVNNLAFQDDEDISPKSSGVQSTPARNNFQRRASSEVVNGTVSAKDHGMAGSNKTRPSCNGLHTVRVPSEDTGDCVNKRPSRNASLRTPFSDRNDNTVKALASKKLSTPVSEGNNVGSVQRKPSSQSSQENSRGYSSTDATRDASTSVSSSGCKSEVDIQSPYTESVCLQMFDDSFDSSVFTTRSWGSELDSTVMTSGNLDDIAEDRGATDTDSVITDDVFNTTVDGECQLDKSVEGKISGHTSSSSDKERLSASDTKFVLPVKHSEKFTKVPVAEKDHVAPVVKADKGEKKLLLLGEDATGEGHTISSMVTTHERPEADIEETNTLIRQQNDHGEDIVDVKENTSTRESIGESKDSKLQSKSSFHITHPREYSKLHDNSRTLVLQSEDVIHCQFLDNDYETYKERRARLSIYSRQPSLMPPRSKDYVLLSCLVMFCCNPLFGIIAFSFSVAVNSTYEAGQYDRSICFSRWSLRMSAVGIAVTCLLVVILFTIYWPDNYRKSTES